MIGKFCSIAIVLVILTATGCATNKIVIPDLGKNKADITLEPGKFRVVRTVSGEASNPFLFWIAIPTALQSSSYPLVPMIAFELGDPNLHQRATRDLHSKHDLRGKPQILHNYLEEWTLANYLGLFAILKVSITAEVIEFTEENAP